MVGRKGEVFGRISLSPSPALYWLTKLISPLNNPSGWEIINNLVTQGHVYDFISGVRPTQWIPKATDDETSANGHERHQQINTSTFYHSSTESLKEYFSLRQLSARIAPFMVGYAQQESSQESRWELKAFIFIEKILMLISQRYYQVLL